MGGFGSTRWNTTPTRRQADGSFRLGAPPAWMVEDGAGLWRWPKFGFFVFCDIGEARALLRYPSGGRLIRQSVGLESTPANLGGLRWWWLCPDCGRRSGKLYLPPRSDVLACRLCHSLSYESAQSSRANYYELFKSCAQRFRLRGPQGSYLRSTGVRPMTATHFREDIRGRMGSFTVAPYAGIPEPLNETKRDAPEGSKHALQ